MSDDDLNAWLIGGDEPLPDDFGLDEPKKNETPREKNPAMGDAEKVETPQPEHSPTPEDAEPEHVEEPSESTPSDGLDDFGLDMDGFGMSDGSTDMRDENADKPNDMREAPAGDDFGLDAIVLNGLDDEPDPAPTPDDTNNTKDDGIQAVEEPTVGQTLPSMGATIMDETDKTDTTEDDTVGTPEGADDPWGGLGGDWNDDGEWDDAQSNTQADDGKPEKQSAAPSQEAQDEWAAGWNDEPTPTTTQAENSEPDNTSQTVAQDDWTTGWEEETQPAENTQPSGSTAEDDTWDAWEESDNPTQQEPRQSEPQETTGQDDAWDTWNAAGPSNENTPQDDDWNTGGQYPEEQYDDSQPDDDGDGDDDGRDLKPLFKTIGIAVAIILLLGLLAGGGAYMYMRHQNQVAQERQQQIVLAQRKKKNDTINGWKTARKNALELVNEVEKSKHKDDGTLKQYCSDIKDEEETKPKNLKQYEKAADELTESTRKLDSAYSKLVQSDVEALQKQADEQVKKANELRKTAADSADRKNMIELANKLDRMNIGEDNMDDASTLIGKLKDAVNKVQATVDAKKKADEDAARQEEEKKQAEAQQQQAQQQAQQQQQQQAQQQYTPAPSYTPQKTYRQPQYSQPSKPSTPSTPATPSQPDNTGTVGGNVG